MFSPDAPGCEPAPTLWGRLPVDAERLHAPPARSVDRLEVVWGPGAYHDGHHRFAIRDRRGFSLAVCEPTHDPPSRPA